MTTFHYETPKTKRWFTMSGDQVEEIILLDKGEPHRLGEVYLGRVLHFSHEANGYFIQLPGGKGFLPGYDKAVIPGQLMTLQVQREPREDKGVSLTRDIELSLDSLVFFKEREGITLSKKLSPQQRQLLKDTFGHEKGLLFRTKAGQKSMDQLKEELKVGRHLLREFDRQEKIGMSPKLLYAPGIPAKASSPTPEERILLEGKLLQLLKEDHLLPEGIVVYTEKTRAGLVVDINGGRYQGSQNTFKDHLTINLKALHYLRKWLDLCQIGGMILVDFISLPPKKKAAFEEAIKAEIAGDESLVFHGITKLGIGEFTRKIGRKSLLELEGVLLEEAIQFRKDHLSRYQEGPFELTLHPKYSTMVSLDKDLKILYSDEVENFLIRKA